MLSSDGIMLLFCCLSVVTKISVRSLWAHIQKIIARFQSCNLVVSCVERLWPIWFEIKWLQFNWSAGKSESENPLASLSSCVWSICYPFYVLLLLSHPAVTILFSIKNTDFIKAAGNLTGVWCDDEQGGLQQHGQTLLCVKSLPMHLFLRTKLPEYIDIGSYEKLSSHEISYSSGFRHFT